MTIAEEKRGTQEWLKVNFKMKSMLQGLVVNEKSFSR